MIEKLYNINVVSINSYNPPPKRRRFNQFDGYKKYYKKIIVKIPPHQSIQILPKN